MALILAKVSPALRPPTLPLACVLALLSGASARASEHEWAVRLGTTLLADDNPPREFSDAGERGAGFDLGVSLLGSASGRRTAERTQVGASYQVGGRTYSRFAQERFLVQGATLEGSVALGRAFGAGVEARAKDRRGGSRAYTDLAASAFLEYVPDVRLDLRLWAGAHRFLYHPALQWSFGAPEVGLSGRYRFDRRHAAVVLGDFGQRGYASLAREPPEGGGGDRVGVTRRDTALTAGVGYRYRGPLALGLTYSYQEQRSNSFGETVIRHRLSGNAGLRLPWRMNLLAQGTVALNRFPDRVYLSPEIILLDDDEAQNSLSVRLARPLGPHLDAELSYGLYGARLPRSGLSYFRQVGALGFSFRFGGP